MRAEDEPAFAAASDIDRAQGLDDKARHLARNGTNGCDGATSDRVGAS
jgi:hypothetical protein